MPYEFSFAPRLALSLPWKECWARFCTTVYLGAECHCAGATGVPWSDSQFRLSAIFIRYFQCLSKQLFLTKHLGTVHKGQNDIKIKSGAEVNIQVSPLPTSYVPYKSEKIIVLVDTAVVYLCTCAFSSKGISWKSCVRIRYETTLHLFLSLNNFPRSCWFDLHFHLEHQSDHLFTGTLAPQTVAVIFQSTSWMTPPRVKSRGV